MQEILSLRDSVLAAIPRRKVYKKSTLSSVATSDIIKDERRVLPSDDELAAKSTLAVNMDASDASKEAPPILKKRLY